MKRFVFGLQAVLGYRRQLEEMALAEYQIALAQEREAEAETSRLRQVLLSECRADQVNVDNWTRMKRDEYKRQLTVLIKVQAERWQALVLVTQEKREKYLESRKETKSLERLREKAFQAYQKEVVRLEQQEMDELFLMKSAGAV
jgi:flagellar FliJ protein